jgi:hypothetical protein
MIPGFNHNIKHKGRVFHIQTEDSGPKNPHIITHLFVGGNIVSSKKTDYKDLVGQPEYEKTVRSMMEEQHKHMLRSLINGVFDTVETATAYHLDGPAPLNTGGASSPMTASMAGSSAFKGLPSQTSAGPPPVRPAMVPQAVPINPIVDITRPVGGIPVTSTPAPAAAAATSTSSMEERHVPGPAGSIFGEDLISEKSLDEVILSYLSEDIPESE